MIKRIGITQRVITLPDRQERRDALDQAWTVFLTACGLEPVLIPNSHPDPVEFAKNLEIRGIILSGGNNFSEVVNKLADSPFGSSAACADTAPERDRTEITLLEAAPYNNWPVLGVCRGMELLNIFYGGALASVKGHAGSHHSLTKKTGLEKLSSATFDDRVNSFHDFGILKENLPAELQLLAWVDNIVEAFIHRQHKQLGIMWHPERNTPFSENDIALFRNFFINR